MTAPVVAGDKRMTVREVAEVLGADESTIRRHIKAIRDNSGNVAGVEHGKTTYLTEAEVTEIKRRIERSGRNDLASVGQAARATTELERRLLVAQAMQILQEDLASARADLAAAAPKVEFFDAVANSRDAITMRDVAAALNIPGWGRNRIFARLRAFAILDDRNIPYREYQDRGYFRVVERSWSDSKGEAHIALTTLVYQKGVDFIRKIVQEPAPEGVSA